MTELRVPADEFRVGDLVHIKQHTVEVRRARTRLPGYWPRALPPLRRHREVRTPTVTTRKPSKPWRVTLTGPGVEVEVEVTSFTSEAKTYAFVLATLGADSPTTSAKIDHWEGGRWWWFETVTADEIRAAQAAADRATEK
ncbi:hypothetical protein OIU91_04410 [Streptomyces sp. NBC_01456]|uniref:hypothetical protein n=1 Tax=unclassified Streptomyces TaxID=2593676 RepID=UPI002E30C4D0|nr:MULTISPECIES: hypothetical protein [unclassified Streptomyces]